jgi:hypothetical protein
MEVLVMESPENGTQSSQVLITFKSPTSIEFDIKLSNVAASQMLLAAQWLDIRARAFIEAVEKAKQDRVARITDPDPQILLPGRQTRLVG